MKLFLTLLSICIFSISSVFARDIYPTEQKQGSAYVKITKISDSHLKFERCLVGEYQKCQILGNKNAYSYEELSSQKTQELWQVAGSVVADVGVVIASAGVGAMIASSAVQFWGIVGLFAGAATGVGSVFFIDSINPVEQFQQARALRADVINDVDINTSDIDIFIKRLDLVLSKIS